MNSCTCENWTLESVSKALLNSSMDNKVIVVPMFQRGKRWKKQQENTFIDSMRKGYPVGTMLFYKKLVNNKENYILVDGLQRGNTIRKYMTNPTEFFSMSEISETVCNELMIALGIPEADPNNAKNFLFTFIQKQKKYDLLPTEYLKISRELCELYEVPFSVYGEKVMGVLTDFFQAGKNDFEQI